MVRFSIPKRTCLTHRPPPRIALPLALSFRRRRRVGGEGVLEIVVKNDFRRKSYDALPYQRKATLVCRPAWLLPRRVCDTSAPVARARPSTSGPFQLSRSIQIRGRVRDTRRRASSGTVIVVLGCEVLRTRRTQLKLGKDLKALATILIQQSKPAK
jgi:hypothetical protein